MLPKKPTILHLINTYQTNEKAQINLLYRCNILKIKCHKCNEQSKIKQDAKSKLKYSLKCEQCNHGQSLLKNSILEGAKLSVFEFIMLVYFYQSKASTQQTQEYLGELSLKTVQTWFDKIRNCTSTYIIQWNFFLKFDKDKGATEWDEVEINQKRKHGRGSFAKVKRKFLLGVQRDTNIVVPEFIGNCAKETLEVLVTNYTENGSVVYTDGLKIYGNLSFYNRLHWTTEHKKTFRNPCNVNSHTNTILKEVIHYLKID